MSTKVAYDLSLFNSNGKVTNDAEKKVVDISQVSESYKPVIKRKHNFLAILSFALIAVVGFMVCTALIKSDAMLSELNNQIARAQEELKEEENAYSQYKMQVESIYSLRVVEDYAVNVLGMVKVENNQKNYVSLDEGDKVEIIQDSENKNIIQKIISAIFGLSSS